jgi:dipeptidyl aminopeptidase/acylaminoacyl peptidase
MKFVSLVMAITSLSGTVRANPDCGVGLISGEPAAARQITDRPYGHILTNVNVWSPDGCWIVYDTRSDPAGEKFDGGVIEMVNVETREVRTIYRATGGAHCGVATFSPTANKVVFIVGPEHPADDWQYAAWHRAGLLVDADPPYRASPLEASDFAPPFTPGALRGGTHVHVFDGEGKWVSFTYEDHILATLDPRQQLVHDLNQRNVGVSVPTPAVRVSATHPRNRGGSTFSVLVTRTTNHPRANSDEISRAFEEAWVGTHGYLRRDGSRQRHAIAFQGHVATADGAKISEVFIVDIPEDVTVAGDSPLEGSATTRPYPPRHTRQRRLTRTEGRRYPGVQGPRHWLRSSPDGDRIAFLMRDDAGVVQIWTISPNGGAQRQLTHLSFDVASAFTWSPDGQSIAFVADNSVFVADATSGTASRLTPRTADEIAPRPEACVFSPDGSRVAYVRRVPQAGGIYNQIFVVEKR